MFRKRYGLAAALAGLVFQAYVASASAADVVATGLKSPRGLDFAPNGQLYVVEAGDIVTTGTCFAGGMGGPQCSTDTGALTLIDPDGIQDPVRVVTGLPTLGDVGPADVSFFGMDAYIAIGLGSDPAKREVLKNLGDGNADVLGTVIRINPGKQSKFVADVSAIETASNPSGGALDSNPFGLVALPGRQIVADAGGNYLVEIKANGKKRLLAIFPPAADGRDRVPTRVIEGPDGYLYVGELYFAGLSTPGDGGAKIYRIPPDGCVPLASCPVYLDAALRTVMDLAFYDGNLYVLQYFENGPPNGALIKYAADGSPPSVVYNALSAPTGLVIKDGYAYVSNRGTCYGVASGDCVANPYGEVLRISLDH